MPETQVFPLGQATQTTPPRPHERVVEVTHETPWQQVLQFDELQLWTTHVCNRHRSEAAQVRQSPPPLPQVKSSTPRWQVPTASTQPVQAAFTQRPSSHRCDIAQTAHTPPSPPQASGRLPGRQPSVW